MNDETLSVEVRAVLEQLTYLSLQADEVEIIKSSQVGAGGSGEVLMAKLRKPYQPEKSVAVKCVWAVGIVGDRRRFAMRFARELKIWAGIRHLNILPLTGFHLDDDCKIARLISPLMTNGNVTQYLRRVGAGTKERLELLHGITAGVSFLHDRSPPICHGDLKPANVLVSDTLEAVICDFGLASLIDELGSTGLTTSHSVKGSSRYMSPELLLGKVDRHTLGSDVWGWGCTAYEVMTGGSPYATAKSEAQIILSIAREQPPAEVDVQSHDFGRDVGTESGLPYATWDLQWRLASSITAAWSFASTTRPTVRNILSGVFCDRTTQRVLGLSPIGHVRIQANVYAIQGSGSSPGQPAVEVWLNDFCYGRLVSDGRSASRSLVDVAVYGIREVIVLDTKCFDGEKSWMLGRTGISVKDLANTGSTSIREVLRYTIKEVQGHVQMECSLVFSHANLVSPDPHGPSPFAFARELQFLRTRAEASEELGLPDIPSADTGPPVASQPGIAPDNNMPDSGSQSLSSLSSALNQPPTTRKRRPKYSRPSLGSCLTCRVRKFKCDEAKPICTRCAHARRECTWPSEVIQTTEPEPNSRHPQSTREFSNGSRATSIGSASSGVYGSSVEDFERFSDSGASVSPQLGPQLPAPSTAAPAHSGVVPTPYSRCRCPKNGGKPSRHWRTACPYNPNRTEARLFECHLCGHKFNRKDNMTRHLRSRHNTEPVPESDGPPS